MTEDEERHADEVNIAFQAGAEWQKKQSDSAWKGIHEGAVLAMQARINELEEKNRKKLNGLLSIIDLCKWGVRRAPSMCSEPEEYCHCMKAFNALDYDLSGMYDIG